MATIKNFIDDDWQLHKSFPNRAVFLVLREISDNVSLVQILIFWLAFCQVTKSYKMHFLPA